jgi:HEAT repeat protein
MTTSLASCEASPLYLGRSLEEWFTEFLSDHYVDGMELPCKALVHLPANFARGEFRDAYRIETEAPNLICQALPCFDKVLIQKATEAIPKVHETKQARLIFSMARTGWQSIPWLVQYLEHPSVNVRAVACLGLGEAILPWEEHGPPVVLDLKKAFLRGPTLSRKDVDVFFDKMEALYESPEAKIPIDGKVSAALVRRLEEESRSVRIAAIETLRLLLTCCKVEAVIRPEAIAALARRLADNSETVRTQAIESLNMLGFQECLPNNQDAGPDDLASHAESPDAFGKALDDWGYVGVLEHLRRLSNDPSLVVRRRAGQILARCKTAEDIRSLSRGEDRNLLQFLYDADPVGGHAAVARQEATYALEWLSEQWEYPEECGNESDSLKPAPILSEPVLQTQERIRQLAKASLATVAEALRERDIGVQIAALDALVEIYRGGQDVSGLVFDKLEDPCQQVRWRAQRTINLMVKHKSGAHERYASL